MTSNHHITSKHQKGIEGLKPKMRHKDICNGWVDGKGWCDYPHSLYTYYIYIYIYNTSI